MRPLDFDPRGMMASEKMDGCQAIFDGGILRTRNGRRMAAPAWFTDGLPDVRLHGELWLGRGTFPELVGTIQRKASDWAGVMFMVFDAHLPGGFQERLQSLALLELPVHCRVIPHRIIGDRAEVDSWEREVVGGGGEGLMLRHPSAPFRPNHGVVKIKRLFPDLDRSFD